MEQNLLRHILDVSRYIAETRDLALLLNYVIDEAIQLVGAERGYVVLVQSCGALDLRVQRGPGGQALEEDEEQVSQSILRQVVESGEPLVLRDAMQDNRFGEAESVVILGLRSIMCVPLVSHGDTTGAIYVENRSIRGRFDQDDVIPLVLFANQAAIAIENARLFQSLQQSQDELEARVKERTIELSEANVLLTQEIAEREQTEERLRSALAEKEALLREVHHRVKNNLQVISSLLTFQADAIEDPQSLDAFQESQKRIESMARIHDQLYRSRDLGQIEMESYIQELADDLRCSFGVYAIDVQVHATGVTMGIDTAIPCGLIVNELISNALKHAFPPEASLPDPEGDEPARRQGKIQLSLRRTQDNGRFELIVRDNGIGLSPELDPQHTKSLGLRLVRVFTRQLQGSIKVDSTVGEGTAFRCTFPAPE